MKQKLHKYLLRCIAVCVLIGIGLSVYAYNNRPREVQYIHEYNLEFYQEQGGEGTNIVGNWRTLAVVKITGDRSIETQVTKEHETLYSTHIQAEVIEVLHGKDITKGEAIYLKQRGNSNAVYVNALREEEQYNKNSKLSRVEESGGYFRKGELLLVLIGPARNRHYENCGLIGKHTCCSVVDYATRTVNPDGSLGYRVNSHYNKYPSAAFPFELPYTQFDTLQEVRDAVPNWVAEMFEFSLKRKLTQEERELLLSDYYQRALDFLYNNGPSKLRKNGQKFIENMLIEE